MTTINSEAVERALRRVRDAIASLEEDALGYAAIQDGYGGTLAYPIRDELLEKIDAALTAPTPADDVVELLDELRQHDRNGNHGKLHHRAADLIASQQARIAALEGVMRRVEPHLGAIICYASTMGEHEPNRIAHDFRALLNQEPSK